MDKKGSTLYYSIGGGLGHITRTFAILDYANGVKKNLRILSSSNLSNMAAGYSIKNIRFRLDIENLFDTEYFDHLSRSFAKNSIETGLPFYEQGRNVKLNVDIII